MAYPTKAEWADAFATTYALQQLGLKYVDSAPIMQAMGPAILKAPGNMKAIWSNGATADYVVTTAGASQGTVVPAFADEINTICPALIGTQAYTDVWSTILQDGSDLDMSMAAAFAAITDDVVGGLVGAGTGAANSIWGIQDFVAQTIPAALDMSVSGSAASANIDDMMDEAIAKLPNTGYNVCIYTNAAEVALVKRLKASGGITPNMLADQAFGSPVLTYRNTLCFSHNRATDIAGTYPGYRLSIFNIGPQGCSIVTPNTAPGLIVSRIQDGGFKESYDVGLAYQIIYNTPSAAATVVFPHA